MREGGSEGGREGGREYTLMQLKVHVYVLFHVVWTRGIFSLHLCRLIKSKTYGKANLLNYTQKAKRCLHFQVQWRTGSEGMRKRTNTMLSTAVASVTYLETR